MALSPQEKLALIFTSAGSQRNVAALTGLSHQQVGRILRIGQEGGRRRQPTDPVVLAHIDVAFAIHKDLTRQVAREHGLPYVAEAPIYAARAPFSEGARAGILGDRVVADHLHWTPDHLKYKWVEKAYYSGKFYNVSAGSRVALLNYSRLADAVAKGKFRNDEERANKKSILRELGYTIRKGSPPKPGISTLEQSEIVGPILTKYTSMQQEDAEGVLHELNQKLRQKHQPAAQGPGTQYFNKLLLQVDTTYGKDTAFRARHPYPGSANTRKAPGNKRKAKPRKARK